ncbi:alcohol dehydrogenase, partial [Bacillus thuringiensis]
MEYLQEVSEFRMPKSVLYLSNTLKKLCKQSKYKCKIALIDTD